MRHSFGICAVQAVRFCDLQGDARAFSCSCCQAYRVLCRFAGLLLSAAARNKHYKLTVGSVGPLILQDVRLYITQACTLLPASSAVFFVCPSSCVVRACCARPPKVLSHLTGTNCTHMDQRSVLRTLAQRKEGSTRSNVLAVQTAIHCTQPVLRATAQFSHGQDRHLDKDQQEPQ